MGWCGAAVKGAVTLLGSFLRVEKHTPIITGCVCSMTQRKTKGTDMPRVLQNYNIFIAGIPLEGAYKDVGG